jgi:hypothetical protein
MKLAIAVLLLTATSAFAGPDMKKPGDQSDIVVDSMERLTKTAKKGTVDGWVVFAHDEAGIHYIRMMVCEDQVAHCATLKKGGVYHVEWMSPKDPDAGPMSDGSPVVCIRVTGNHQSLVYYLIPSKTGEYEW